MLLPCSQGMVSTAIVRSLCSPCRFHVVPVRDAFNNNAGFALSLSAVSSLKTLHMLLHASQPLHNVHNMCCLHTSIVPCKPTMGMQFLKIRARKPVQCSGICTMSYGFCTETQLTINLGILRSGG